MDCAGARKRHLRRHRTQLDGSQSDTQYNSWQWLTPGPHPWPERALFQMFRARDTGSQHFLLRHLADRRTNSCFLDLGNDDVWLYPSL